MVNKNDLRVIKTKNLLYSTLLDLMKDRPFEMIKVSDICNAALINRSTFYAHYNDKYELLVDFINTLKQKLIEALNVNEKEIYSKEYYLELIKILMEHFDNERDIYYPIIMSNQNSIVMDILLDVINNDINEVIEADTSKKWKVPSKIITTFYIGGIINFAREYIKNSNKYTEEEIIEYLNVLIPDSIWE